jgi:hypothetical protein
MIKALAGAGWRASLILPKIGPFSGQIEGEVPLPPVMEPPVMDEAIKPEAIKPEVMSS